MPDETNKRELVEQWISDHPEGKQRECVEQTGVSKSYVSRIWAKLHPGKAHGRRKTATREHTAASDNTDRITVALTPDAKQRLNIICAVRGTSISDWVQAHIESDYKTVRLPD